MAWQFEAIEDQIIHLTLKDRTFAVNVINELEPDLFEDDSCRIIFHISQKFFNNKQVLPTYEQFQTIISTHQFKKLDLLVVKRVYQDMELSVHEIEFVKEVVPKFVKHNKFKNLLIEGSLLLSDPKNLENQDQVFMDFESKFKQILQYNIDQDLGLEIYDLQTRYQKLKSREEQGVRPALEIFANYIKGYFPKELYSYVGMPSVGKSILLAADALQAVRDGFNTVLISMEMSEELFGLRIDQSVAGKEARELLNDQEAYKFLESRYKTMKTTMGGGRLFIKEFPTGEASVHHIERYLELLKIYEDFTPEFVVIDYGDIMRPNHKSSGDRYNDQGRVFQELRAFAKAHNFPVLTAMQTNRPSREFSGPITEERIADSFDKIRTLDGCYSINQKTVGVDENSEALLQSFSTSNEHYLYIIKNRHGKKEQKVPFIMNKLTMTVEDKIKESEEKRVD